MACCLIQQIRSDNDEAAIFFKKKKGVANTPVLITVNTNIKVPVNSKLQLMRHTGTLTFT